MNSKLRNRTLPVQDNLRARAGKPLVTIVVAMLMLLALSACDLSSLTGLPTQSIDPSRPAVSSTPGVPGASDAPGAPSAPEGTGPSATTPTPGAKSSGAQPAAVAAIKAVVEKANQEQIQAFASGNPSVMADTATSSYYQEMAQNYSDMANSGITAIELTKLTWGAVTLQD